MSRSLDRCCNVAIGTFLGKICILPGSDVAHKIIPNRVGAVFFDQHERIDNVPALLLIFAPPRFHQP